jgi:hypothetical protein
MSVRSCPAALYSESSGVQAIIRKCSFFTSLNGYIDEKVKAASLKLQVTGPQSVITAFNVQLEACSL